MIAGNPFVSFWALITRSGATPSLFTKLGPKDSLGAVDDLAGPWPNIESIYTPSALETNREVLALIRLAFRSKPRRMKVRLP